MNKKIIISIVAVQIFIIFFLVVRISQKQKEVLSATVSRISKEETSLSPSGDLKYFYEPKVNNLTGKDKFLFTQDVKPYTINSDSLNDRYDYSVQKPEGAFRIITLGDSVTFGLHVNTADNWTEVLEDKLNSEMKCPNIKKFEVINLAVSGYDDRYSLERYVKRGEKYGADAVIWMQVDPLRINELLIPALNSVIAKNGGSEESASPLFVQERQLIVDSYGRDNILNYNKKAIKSLGQYFNGSVVIFPYGVSIRNGDDKEWLRKISEEKDNWNYFEGIKDLGRMNGIFKDDGHPNEVGHKIIAGDIFNYLKSGNIIPCTKYP